MPTIVNAKNNNSGRDVITSLNKRNNDFFQQAEFAVIRWLISIVAGTIFIAAISLSIYDKPLLAKFRVYELVLL